MKILVTGANGQLGSELKEIAKKNHTHFFYFIDVEDLDITSKDNVKKFFEENEFDFCINCAAYTAVDKSESDIDSAIGVNVKGVENLALACRDNKIILIHISTDFVFDGIKHFSYKEEDRANPINIYGKTKLEGEQKVNEILKNYFIIRTSWLYSSYGNNFVKTMLRLAETKDSLGIVDDQIGTPTYARDLAEIIIKLIDSNCSNYGVFHYSNEGIASWYDFAYAIFEYSKKEIKLDPIGSKDYPLPAKRPKFTVLNKNKIKSNLDITIPHWIKSLKDCIELLES